MVRLFSGWPRSIRRGPLRGVRSYSAGLLAAALLAGLPLRTSLGQETLETIREDVRRLPSADADRSDHSESDSSSESPRRRKKRTYDGEPVAPEYESGLWMAGFVGTVFGVTAPFWGPPKLVGDDYALEAQFARYPYRDGMQGYLALPDGTHNMRCVDRAPQHFRRFSGRFSAEHHYTGEDLQTIAGRLIVETTPRWGVDAQFDYLEETLSGGRYDALWLGDFNVTYRFAQSERMQFRTGLGLNWLDDAGTGGGGRTDFGFNFTYGFDLMPVEPWIISAEVDWGTLGEAELFRFRSTAGAILWGVESYLGYEYLDIDRTQTNSLIGGVRVWF